jgi:hypothetical protein
MRSPGVRVPAAALIFIWISGFACGQTPTGAGGGPLRPLADSLRAKGIELTEPALISALRNPDPEVRSLAAMKLGEDHDSDAVPAVETALADEKVLKARIEISMALWSLHDPKGAASLREMCEDASLSIRTIVDVVQDLDVIGESSAPCAGRLTSFLETHKDTDSRSIALSALPAVIRWAPKAQAARLTELVQAMLADNDPVVRMESGHLLAQIGSPSSAVALRDAIDRESDNGVRSSLQRDLLKLQPRGSN